MATEWKKSSSFNDNQPPPPISASPIGSFESPRQRKKLQLKPRSASLIGSNHSQSKSSSLSKSNPFGAAKPREEVLASKGIDPSTIDSRINRKAVVAHYTKDQEAQIETLRTELTKAEKDLREANEKEMPEEAFRVKAEGLRKELNALMANFRKQNEANNLHPPTSPRFERPKTRRNDFGNADRQLSANAILENTAAYASFASTARRRRSNF